MAVDLLGLNTASEILSEKGVKVTPEIKPELWIGLFVTIVAAIMFGAIAFFSIQSLVQKR